MASPASPAPVPAPAQAVTLVATPTDTPTKSASAASTPTSADGSTTPVTTTTPNDTTLATTPVTATVVTTTPVFNSPVTRTSNSPVAASTASPSAPLGPCVLRKYYTCAATEKERVQRCERDGCIKFIHRSCSLRVTEPFRDHAEPFHVVCGKRCFNAITKSRALAAVGGAPAAISTTPIKQDASTASVPVATATTMPTTTTTWSAHSGERKKRSPWNSDGPSATVNSLSVLLAWLREPKNYARWVNGGDETKFETKAALATQILALIKAKGITTDRNRNDVFAKIYQLEKSFAEAAEWVAANDKTLDDANLAAGARKRCAFYHDLAPSMGIKHGKRGIYGDGSRKRSAATANVITPAAAAAALDGVAVAVDSVEPVAKRQHVASMSARETDVNSAAAELVATIEAQATAAATSDVTAAPDASAIAPVVLTNSFANAGASSSEALNAAHLAALVLSSGASKSASGAADGATQLNYALLQAVADKLQADAKSAAVAASTALLRARKTLRDEGVPQVEIDTALPLARSA